jgi:hypothetical protein
MQHNIAEPAPLLPVPTPVQPPSTGLAPIAPVLLPEPAQDVPLPVPMPISGVMALSESNRKSLCALGRVLADIPADAESLPATYVIFEQVSQVADDGADTDDESCRALLPHVERMSMGGLTPAQIAARLGLTIQTVQEASCFLQDFYQALKGGRARGLDLAADALRTRIDAGDASAARFYLQAKATDSWSTSQKPLVQVNVNTGSQVAPVDLQEIQDMKERQSRLLDDVDYDSLD